MQTTERLIELINRNGGVFSLEVNRRGCFCIINRLKYKITPAQHDDLIDRVMNAERQ